jgi:hypothetical protein
MSDGHQSGYKTSVVTPSQDNSLDRTAQESEYRDGYSDGYDDGCKSPLRMRDVISWLTNNADAIPSLYKSGALTGPDATSVIINPSTGRTSVFAGTDQSIHTAYQTWETAARNQTFSSRFWCMSLNPSDIVSRLKDKCIEGGDQPHDVSKWLILPSEQKRLAFVHLKTIEPEHIRVEQDAKIEFAVWRMMRDLHVFTGDREKGCECGSCRYMENPKLPISYLPAGTGEFLCRVSTFLTYIERYCALIRTSMIRNS